MKQEVSKYYKDVEKNFYLRNEIYQVILIHVAVEDVEV